MASMNVLDQTGKKVGQCEAAFMQGVVNKAILYEVIKRQLASRRTGTHSTKTRGEVSGSYRKIYRQKGTGNARHGSRYSNIFVGGGRAHGPRPRNYVYQLPKKVAKAGIKSALLLKQEEEAFLVIDQISFKDMKTKNAKKLLESLKIASGLFVLAGQDDNVKKSFRNLPNTKVVCVEGVNAFDVLNFDYLVVTKGALEKLQGRLG